MLFQVVRTGFVSIAAVVVFLLGGCTTSSSSRGNGVPQWVNDKDSVYPPERYLAEVGEGDSLKGAKSNAVGALAQIFRTQVTVDSKIRTRYTEITGEGGDILDMVSQTDIHQTIGQKADESLVNVKYSESWQDAMGRVYVVAYLDRGETGFLYRQRIMENDERVAELLERAEAQEDPLRRYAFLDAALVMAEVTQASTQQLEIINMAMAHSIIHPYDLGAVQAAKADQASGLKIRIEAAGDPGNRITPVLSDWVTERGFSVSDGGDMFLTAVVTVSEVELENNYENLNWEMTLTLMDSFGYPVVTLPRQNRSSGISLSAAEARAYQDMRDLIQKDFDRDFTAYLTSFLEK